MNLLPFIIIIILVLGMFSLSQFQRSHSLEKEKNLYIIYFKGLRQIRNDLENAYYEKAKKILSNSKSDPTKETSNTPKDTLFFRERMLGWSSGKLNLSSLLNDASDSLGLKEICIKYLLLLYGHTDFFPKNPQYLLDCVIEKLKTEQEII